MRYVFSFILKVESNKLKINFYCIIIYVFDYRVIPG